MSYQKIIEGWKQNPPTYERIDRVLTVIKRYFVDRFEHKHGSHIKIWHENLATHRKLRPEEKKFSIHGEFSIFDIGGQKVCKSDIKKILEAMEIIEEIEKYLQRRKK